MPVVLRIRGFKFYFYANEGDEPPHVRRWLKEHTGFRNIFHQIILK